MLVEAYRVVIIMIILVVVILFLLLADQEADHLVGYQN